MNRHTGFFDAWAQWLSMTSIQAIVFILFVLATCWLIRKSSQWAQCWLWRLVFLKLVLLLVFVSPIQLPILPSSAADSVATTEFHFDDSQAATISHLAAQGDDLVSSESSQAPMVSHSEPMESLSNSAPIKASSTSANTVSSSTNLEPFDLRAVLLTLWLTEVAIGITILARAFYVHSIFRRQLMPIEDSRYSELLAQLGQRFNISRTPSLALSAATQSPCLMGLLKPVIVIPENLAEQFDDEKIKMIIAHELAHHKRRDLWWCWLPTISRIVFFFNPLVWVALKKWNIAKEMACDELVLNVTNFSPATYAEVLVNIASKAIRSRLMASPASISMIQSSSLKRRLLAMSHITNPGRFSTRSISLFLLILLTAMVGLIPWQPVEKLASAQETESAAALETPTEKLISNLDFDQADEKGTPLNWGGGGIDYAITVDDNEPYRGKYSAKLTFVGDKEPAYGVCTRRIDADPFHGKRIAFRGYLKTDLKDDGKVGLWMRVDEDAKAVSFDIMMDRPVKGKTDWKQYHIVLDVPATADYITFGFLLSGAGECWCDDMTLEVDGNLKESDTSAKGRANRTLPPKGIDRDQFVEELRKYQENFKNRFEVTKTKRKELEKQHTALRVAGHGSVHAVMVVEIAKTMQAASTQLVRLQLEKAKNERAKAAGPDAVKARVLEIQPDGRRDALTAVTEALTALTVRLVEAKANTETLRQKLGAGHPDFESAKTIVKTIEQQLADLKEHAKFAADEGGIQPEVIFARKNAEIEQEIKDLKLLIAEQDERWNAHNKEAIRLSKIQERMKRLDIELDEIRAAQRLGAELLMRQSLNPRQVE